MPPFSSFRNVIGLKLDVHFSFMFHSNINVKTQPFFIAEKYLVAIRTVYFIKIVLHTNVKCSILVIVNSNVCRYILACLFTRFAITNMEWWE
jgi:hypothetical protein